MICYAIKYKDKYYKNGKNHWTNDIRKCTLWNKEYKVYWFITGCFLASLPNCEVVKVEIGEVEELK